MAVLDYTGNTLNFGDSFFLPHGAFLCSIRVNVWSEVLPRALVAASEEGGLLLPKLIIMAALRSRSQMGSYNLFYLLADVFVCVCVRFHFSATEGLIFGDHY